MTPQLLVWTLFYPFEKTLRYYGDEMAFSPSYERKSQETFIVSIEIQTSFQPYILIPLHGVAITTPLVIFQRICQRCRIGSEGEIVACVWCQHYGATHVETMKVALQ